MIVKRKTGLETYVLAYISKLKNTNQLRSEAPYIRKAIKMIEFAIGNPCCDDIDAISSFGRRDNALTNAVRGILLTYPLMRNARKSYEKTIRLLQRLLYDPCCYSEIELDLLGLACFGDGSTISFVGRDGQGTFTTEIPTINTSLSLPLAGDYDVVVNTPNPSSGNVYVNDPEGNPILTVAVIEGNSSASGYLSAIDVSGVTSVTADCGETPVPEDNFTVGTNQMPGYSGNYLFYDSITEELLATVPFGPIVGMTAFQEMYVPTAPSYTITVQITGIAGPVLDSIDIYEFPGPLLETIPGAIGTYVSTVPFTQSALSLAGF